MLNKGEGKGKERRFYVGKLGGLLVEPRVARDPS